jgi:hypothetical protein
VPLEVVQVDGAELLLRPMEAALGHLRDGAERSRT